MNEDVNAEAYPAALYTLPAATLGLLLSVATIWAVWHESPLLWAIPLALLGGWAAVSSRPDPHVVLGLTLALQVFQIGGAPGITLTEVVAGLALVFYLGHWYTYTFLSGREVVTTLFDAAALSLGTVGFAFAIGMGIVTSGFSRELVAEILATLPFLLYLPVKDLCRLSDKGIVLMAIIFVFFGLFSTISNGIQLHQAVTGATEVWEIADARFGVGETSITAGLMMTFAGLAVSRRPLARVLLVALAGVLLGGLILTKSRGFWVSSVLGLVVLGMIATPTDRKRFIGAVLWGVIALVALVLGLFADQASLLVSGTIKRLVTLSSATTADVSLINRFYETQAAWDMVTDNPVLGYGLGVPISRYDIISGRTFHWVFLHNGYIALWVKTGLWGLGLMLFVWVGALVRGCLALRTRGVGRKPRAVALGAVATLAAFSLAAITSNPFSVLDQMMLATLTLAVAHGVADRVRWALLHSHS